jgi:hypothetical protein
MERQILLDGCYPQKNSAGMWGGLAALHAGKDIQRIDTGKNNM